MNHRQKTMTALTVTVTGWAGGAVSWIIPDRLWWLRGACAAANLIASMSGGIWFALLAFDRGVDMSIVEEARRRNAGVR